MHFTFCHVLLLSAGLLAAAGCARRVPPAERVNVNNVSALRTALGGDKAAAPVEAGPAAEPTGFATIKGTFKLSGPAPARPVLDVKGDDRAICAPGGKQVLSENFVVDQATGGIRDVVIYLNDKKYNPKWEHPDYAAAATGTPDFDQKNCVFLSHMMVLRTTQRMRILNSDPVGHNTNILAIPKASPFNQTIPSGGAVMYDPGGETPEPFNVACSIHNWMSANMLVRNNPYFAVTKADGSFEIANVPAGVDLEFRVWQEKTRFIPKITLNGEKNEKFRGRLKLKLNDGETRTLDAVVDAADLPK